MLLLFLVLSPLKFQLRDSISTYLRFLRSGAAVNAESPAHSVLAASAGQSTKQETALSSAMQYIYLRSVLDFPGIDEDCTLTPSVLKLWGAL
jgi:hypothetical protein